jgi:hypothetical protein
MGSAVELPLVELAASDAEPDDEQIRSGFSLIPTRQHRAYFDSCFGLNVSMNVCSTWRTILGN